MSFHVADPCSCWVGWAVRAAHESKSTSSPFGGPVLEGPRICIHKPPALRRSSQLAGIWAIFQQLVCFEGPNCFGAIRANIDINNYQHLVCCLFFLLAPFDSFLNACRKRNPIFANPDVMVWFKGSHASTNEKGSLLFQTQGALAGAETLSFRRFTLAWGA